jgi:hypothetical protein
MAIQIFTNAGTSYEAHSALLDVSDLAGAHGHPKFIGRELVRPPRQNLGDGHEVIRVNHQRTA